MDTAKQHWKILQELGNDLENRVRSFLVIGKNGEGVIVVTENGDGYWLGEMKFGLRETKTATKPTPLDVPGLVQMAQSDSHIMLLNKQGQIYTIGMKYRRQQISVDIENLFTPQLIPIPHKFTSVRCGFGFCLALTEDGNVWAWGWNEFGQVGVPSSTVKLIPRQIPELNPHRIVAVECGECHSLALTDQSEVYAWGCNHFGQLGNGSETSTHIPTRMSTPSPIKCMAADFNHTLLLTRTGEVYTCGRNGYGPLVPNQNNSNPYLSKVAGLPSILQIASHPLTNFSIAMSHDQRCFVWGKLTDGTIITTPRELPPFYSTVESPLSFYSPYRNTPHSVSIPIETPPSLSNRMSRMFDNPETSDVQFVVEQRTIHAHRIILSNSSDYFAQMFSERWLAPVDPEDPIVKVIIPDHSYPVFHFFLRFLYTDSYKLHSDLIPELFVLTSQYLESDLQQHCLTLIRTTLTLTPSTFCLYYPLTYRYSFPELAAFQKELVQFAFTNFLEVISTPAFKSMDAKLCKKLTLSMAYNSP